MACKIDQMFDILRQEAEEIARDEPILRYAMQFHVFKNATLAAMMARILAEKTATATVSNNALQHLFLTAFEARPVLLEDGIDDIRAVFARDPATQSRLSIVMSQKGFQALQIYRLAHHLWNSERRPLALFLQSRASEVLGVDIHPASKIGKGIMLDHSTGIVIGETCIVGDNVSIMQSVTLGGTGHDIGDRHPKVEKDVFIGAGATILGNIVIGEKAKIGAGSVVLEPVPPRTTVVGVPAKVVNRQPAHHFFDTMFSDISSSKI